MTLPTAAGLQQTTLFQNKQREQASSMTRHPRNDPSSPLHHESPAWTESASRSRQFYHASPDSRRPTAPRHHCDSHRRRHGTNHKTEDETYRKTSLEGAIQVSPRSRSDSSAYSGSNQQQLAAVVRKRNEGSSFSSPQKRKKSWSSAELLSQNKKTWKGVQEQNNRKSGSSVVEAKTKKEESSAATSSSGTSDATAKAAIPTAAAEVVSVASTCGSSLPSSSSSSVELVAPVVPPFPFEGRGDLVEQPPCTVRQKEENTRTGDETKRQSSVVHDSSATVAMTSSAVNRTEEGTESPSSGAAQQKHPETRLQPQKWKQRETVILDTIASQFAEARNDNNSVDSSDDSDEETDDEEVMAWGRMMFGIQAPVAAAPPPSATVALPEEPSIEPEVTVDTTFRWEDFMPPVVSLAERVKMRRGHQPELMETEQKKRPRSRRVKKGTRNSNTIKKKTLVVKEKISPAEAKRRKELARPLTAADLRKILAEDEGDCGGIPCSESWVRRSVRLPSRALLTSKNVQSLLEKLRENDRDMEVLKMKKYLSDPDAPAVVIDAALDALEENTNCQALYIQNFNKGMRDAQVLHLLSVLQLPTCKIWCLNVGETYNVSMKTWKIFTKGLKQTKITHMYASEHTITPELKDQIRGTIRRNRSKHSMHDDPSNLDIIVRCTHCWWNPINAKVLRPYLRRKGYEHILYDKEALGLKGTMSGAPGDERPA